MMFRRSSGFARVGVVLLALVMFLTACGGSPAGSTPGTTKPSGGPSGGQDSAPAGGSNAGTQAPTGPKFKVAMILPGTVEDSDYNFVGYQALQAIQKELNLETKHQEKVAVADAERVARGFINDGFNIVAFHGGQYVTAVQKLAPEFPKVTFIMESGGRMANLPDNVWNLGRRFYEGFYALGTLGASASKAGKIGVIAGVKLPDFVASINAVKAAAKSVNPKAEVVYTFVGDQNDPVKARQAAEAQVSQGVDFIILVVNLGAYGVVEAVKGKPVLVTTYYTDKSSLAPQNFVGSLITDFSSPYLRIINGIMGGANGGYDEMRPGNGFTLSKLTNVPDDMAQKVQAVFEQVAKQEIKVEEKADAVVE